MVFAAGDFDAQVSEWAIREKPIFGTKTDATITGATLRDIVVVGSVGTALATPSGGFAEWGPNKAKGLAVETAAALAPQGVARYLKEWTHKLRPDASDNLSFPSTQATECAAWSAVARRNVASLPIDHGYRIAIDSGFGALTLISSWSRVENGKHYPSDCLAGISLGNFLGLFIHDTFLGPQWRDLTCCFAPTGEGMELQISTTF
jgi:hypothetical protein